MYKYLGMALKFKFEALSECEAKKYSFPFLSSLNPICFTEYGFPVLSHNRFYEIKYQINKCVLCQFVLNFLPYFF